MSRSRHSMFCALFAFASTLLLAAPGQPESEAALGRMGRLMRDRGAALGLGEEASFAVLDVQEDGPDAPDAQRGRHVRFQQRYRGLRVWGGQAVLHVDGRGVERPMTDALVRGIRLEVRPNLDQAEALAIAHASEAPQGGYARPPAAELVVYPETALQRRSGAAGGNAMDFAPRITRNHLAYHVRLELENGSRETRHDDYLVDANTGAILRKWSSLLTLAPAKGTPATTVGRSQYSGEVRLGSLSTACGYVMADPTRGNISTRDLAGGTEGDGVLYSNAEGRWGDGQNYDPGRGSKSENGQTAAVDAHYGLQTAWDFYRNVLGRDGIDGKGSAARNLVHYSSGYDNAFWSDDCFCMTYGDGTTFKTLTALDVVGHEVSHGLCHATADLDYDGETGGLNEASSDIFGVMVRLYGYAAKGEGSFLPDRGARWTIGDELETKSFPTPIRYLYKPSLDGFSPDAWSEDLDLMDVHYASGPMNRAFYFLCEGASAKAKEESYSSYLPKGMRGIGNDKALRIWWRTLSLYLTPRSRYMDARHGALRAAGDLYGKGSPEAQAVAKAFQAVNVGRNATILP